MNFKELTKVWISFGYFPPPLPSPPQQKLNGFWQIWLIVRDGVGGRAPLAYRPRGGRKGVYARGLRLIKNIGVQRASIHPFKDYYSTLFKTLTPWSLLNYFVTKARNTNMCNQNKTDKDCVIIWWPPLMWVNRQLGEED